MTASESLIRELVKRAQARLETLSDRSFFLVALLPLLTIYLATASFTTVHSSDPFTNATTAWKLGTSGSFYLDEHTDLVPYAGGAAWIIERRGRTISVHPPGAALLAAPLYAVWPDDADLLPAGHPRRQESFQEDFPIDILMPPLAPAALVAATATAIAVALVGLTGRPLVGSNVALAAAYIWGLGTGAWAVAADDLWQHGPNLLWIALGIWLATRDRLWLSGLAFGMAVLTRPTTAIVAASVGLLLAWKRRSPAPALRIGVGATAGLVAVIVYNAAVFGSASISGGYGETVRPSVTGTDLAAYARNIIDGLVDPARGLLTLSPFVALLIVGTIFVWRSIPPAVLGGAIGAVLYLLVQWKAENFSGGSGFIGYRYPLEALGAAAPALMMAWKWISKRRITRVLFGYATAYSLTFYTFSSF